MIVGEELCRLCEGSGEGEVWDENFGTELTDCLQCRGTGFEPAVRFHLSQPLDDSFWNRILEKMTSRG